MSQNLNLNGFLSHFLSIPSDKIAFKLWNEKKQALEKMLYKDFFRSVEMLASALDQLTQPKVMIIGSKGPFSAAAILATWFKHGCYLPATPQMPSQRIENMIRVFKPEIIFVETITEELKNIFVDLAEDHKIVICKSKNSSTAFSHKNIFFEEEFPTSSIQFSERPANLSAYIMTTSGTSGLPKFVEIKDIQLSAYYENIMQLLPQGHVNGLIQNFEITFDPSIGDLLWCFSKQAYFVPLKSTHMRDINLILKSETDLWWSSTPSYADWTQSFLDQQTNLSNCIRHSFFLGEKLFSTTCEAWKRFFKSTSIHNLYGPTEATISISYHTYSSIEDSPGVVPIGKIHPGHRYELNHDRILSIFGPQVGSGYFISAPEDKNFFKDLSSQPGYCTGDVCEVKNENLVVLGRLDSQIKIHGQRFELEEMENFLKANGIEVVLFPVSGENKTVDFIGAASLDFSLTLEKLHFALKNQFPMIFFPKEILHKTEFPLTPNQKVDRKKLIEMYLRAQS